ncbi:glycosyltransferase family 4 protein [Mangrovimonas sp. CR14]|uniref:glycosyltransferase n=1 Tax=Mangrovimonas sp. CR14 TaxID=2706120 RepID=UPI00141FD0DE|nr:glycosyltransferase [Mangrovimonas sp. CR14]NIK92679.1 glycosyltransferase family 4 protein [Mangrovimonas sp. CR14]
MNKDPKKILFFYPENPLQLHQGNNARALALLKYFREREFEVDFVGEQKEGISFSELESLKNLGFVNNCWLLPDTKSGGLKYLFQVSLPKKMSKIPKAFDRRKLGQQQAFNDILKGNNYDFVLISYSCWIPLVLNNPYLKDSQIIVDTHDLLTSQFKSYKSFELGSFFSAEMQLLDAMDRVWAISIEEKYLFEQFLSSKVDLVPHIQQKHEFHVEKSIDILYVASDNEHNRIGARWFFDHVYPMLSNDLKITVVGKVGDFIPDGDQIKKIRYVEDLTEVYAQARVVICPMFSGTGLKIKVVEALSHGLPVVCNERGVDGLINKTRNGCLVTNSPTKFSGFIDKLLNDIDFYKEHSSLAHSFFDEQFSKEQVYSKLDSIFEIE